MNDRPLVSIVTPTLNQGSFIEATISSIRAQTYHRFEHIVVDGGSTDETLDILRRHEGAYPMRWLSEPDRGMYDALNKGLRLASGEVIAYLNSDDLYFPWTLQTVVEAFAAHPDADVVFGDALGIQQDGGEEDLRFQPPFRFDFLLRSGSFVQPTVFWRRRVGEAVGEFNAELRLAGDLDYWLRMGPHRRYLKVDELLAIERDHLGTKRSSQWDSLMRESAAIRAPYDHATAMRRRTGLIAGRFRAWLGRRRLWARFAWETRRRRSSSGRPWARFLAASSVQLSVGRLLAAQIPWLGRRIAPGSLDSGVDWLRAGQPTGERAPTGRLARLSDDWDDLAEQDPFWAILSDPAKRGGRWDLKEFLESGEREIDRVLERGRVLGHPSEFGRALDFGCGVGRVTSAMAPHFAACVGVDISSSMVDRARTLHRGIENASFLVNPASDLRTFDDRSFDLVYSDLVLQHLPDQQLIGKYVAEFARVLSVGGLLVFQVPSSVPFRYRIQARRRLYHALRALKFPVALLQGRLHLHPIRMTSVPENDVVDGLRLAGLTVLEVEHATIKGFGIESCTYWATRRT
jgi:glycosyltransferase involved in cell wall biosynthesis/SAM-dependent methyltransferase